MKKGVLKSKMRIKRRKPRETGINSRMPSV
jgi:hypothetical protein